MILVGSGRLGSSLARRANERGVTVQVIRRGETLFLGKEPPRTPVLVAVRNDDLTSVLAQCPLDRWGDLVFMQNGMLRPWIAEHGLADNSRGIVYFAAAARDGEIIEGGRSVFTGPHAAAVVAWFDALGIGADVVAWTTFANVEFEKLVWNSIFGLLSESHGCTVGEVVRYHRAEVAAITDEFLGVGQRALGVRTDGLSLLERLCVYSLSIEGFRGSLREWRWRNGWFVEAAQQFGLAMPVHDAALRRVDAFRRFASDP